MRTHARPQTQGFTLIELLIAMSVFLLVLLGIYNVFDTNRQTYVSGTRKVDVQQNARVALDQIARETRMAGYYPELYDPDGGTTTSLANPYGVLVATENGLVVYGDLDGTCPNPGQGACPANSSNVFLYCLGGDQTIRRKRSTNGTVPPAFMCSGGDVVAENIATLKFTYYDGNQAVIPVPTVAPKGLDGQVLGSVPAFNPATDVRPTIRTIVITIGATESVPGPGQQPQSITLTSSVRLRNLNP